MDKFQIGEKLSPQKILPGMYIVLDNELWRVQHNFNVLGRGRMFALSYHTHKDPKGYRFYHHQDDLSIQTYQQID